MKNLFALELKTKDPLEVLVALSEFFQDVENLPLEECIPSWNAVCYFAKVTDNKKGVDTVLVSIISRVIVICEKEKNISFLERFHGIVKLSEIATTSMYYLIAESIKKIQLNK